MTITKARDGLSDSAKIAKRPMMCTPRKNVASPPNSVLALDPEWLELQQRHIEGLIATLKGAQEAFLTGLVEKAADRCVVITETAAPNRIVACSREWSALCGFEPDEAIGMTTKILQGECTDADAATAFKEDVYNVTAGSSARAQILNYTKFGRAFVHTLETTLIRDSDGAEYFCTESYEHKPAVTPLLPTRSLAVGS